MPHGALENVKLAGERDIDPRVAKTDDIPEAVPVHVAKLARKLIVADPAAIVGRECTGCVLDWGEVAAAGGERDIDPRLAEADNVGHAVAVYVGEFARILVIADPAPDIASGPECVDLELHGAETPPVASATYAPLMPKPTMSAMPSPLTSPSSRGYCSSPIQPPTLLPV